MEFSKTFKTIWWVILVISIGLYLYQRFDQLVIGKSVTADIVVFLVWVALCLGPLFKEIELPGIKLKQEIKDLKNNVEKELSSIRNKLRVNSDIRSNVSPSFWVGSPPPDANLPNIESNIKKVIEETLQSYGHSTNTEKPTALNVDQDVTFLFQARHNIEKELRYIISQFENSIAVSTIQRRFMPLHKMLSYLTTNEIISTNLAGAVKEIYSVCSPAIHGEDVSEAKIAFVKDTAPEVIGTLRAISRRTA